MKHLKKFENFEFGRFNDDIRSKDSNLNNDFEENDFDNFDSDEVSDICAVCGMINCDICDDIEESEEESEESNRVRKWGDEEIVEKKKINAGFQAYLDKQKVKNSKDDKKDSKDDKKDKVLTKAQKRLPKAMQDAILKKMNK